jgi:hypothetical protein
MKRILRIENKDGDGFMSSLPSYKAKLSEDFKQAIANTGLTDASLLDVISNTYLIYCYRGGEIICKDLVKEFTLSEIEVLQLFLLLSIDEKDISHPFHFMFFKDYKNIVINRHTKQLTAFEFLSEMDFIEAINSRGFKLYFFEIDEQRDALLVRTNNDYEVLYTRDEWEPSKRLYIPSEEKGRGIVKPIEWLQVSTKMYEDMKTNNPLYV